MLQTVVLIVLHLITIGLTLRSLKRAGNFSFRLGNLSFQTVWPAFIMSGLLSPLFEEILFRVILKYFLSGMSYAYIINAILYGALHGLNYITTKDIRNVIIQSIFTTYFGYYVVQFDNFWSALLLHIFMNISITISSLIYCTYMHQNEINDKLENEINNAHKTIKDLSEAISKSPYV
jgi:membrane protease YdiL (CAAX protease family)